MHNHHATTTTHPARRSFLSRFTAPRTKTTSRSTRHTTTAPRSHGHGHNNYSTAHNNHTAVRAPARRRGAANPTLHRHKAVVKHKTTFGDKVSGAMMRLKGSLTHRPGLKIAGERRMHGTDGRTTRHY